MREVVEHLFMLQRVLTPEMPMHVCHPRTRILSSPVDSTRRQRRPERRSVHHGGGLAHAATRRLRRRV